MGSVMMRFMNRNAVLLKKQCKGKVFFWIEQIISRFFHINAKKSAPIRQNSWLWLRDNCRWKPISLFTIAKFFIRFNDLAHIFIVANQWYLSLWFLDRSFWPAGMNQSTCLFDTQKIQNTKLQKRWKWDCKCRDSERWELGNKLLYYYNNIIIYI